ncbi:MAG: pimeloyl-ACP methyl ester carboxylesterase [Crocinitomicaceae bacterium]|jgi:pimeloyl-ACP methyl ester carboxylesterase
MNIKLNYETVQSNALSNDEFVLLFLHEALGSIRQWRSFPQDLCDRLGTNGIVYERQGHGSSDAMVGTRTSTYLHDYAFEELPYFIENVVPKEKKIILVGHSDGGTIALLYASRFPDRIAQIVTIAAHVINEPETVAGIQPAIEAFEKGKLDGLKKYHGEKTTDLFYAWANTWKDGTFKNWDISSEIASSEISGLFMQGEEDQYGTSKQLQLIEENFGGKSESHLLKNCGHHPHLEQPEIVLDLIKHWIAI